MAKTKSEARTQQELRIKVAEAGGLTWRNNVGATPSKCPKCNAQFRPVRYGLANDSKAVNEHIKSSDLVGIVPRVITEADVGKTIGQFLAVEMKHEGWHYRGDDHERAQLRWLELVAQYGGIACFSTGDIEL